MTPATVEDAYSMLLEAVAIDDPVIFCEHKYLYYHLKAEKLPTEAMPVGKARIARPGRVAGISTPPSDSEYVGSGSITYLDPVARAREEERSA